MCTTGMSACATAPSNACGRFRPVARATEASARLSAVVRLEEEPSRAYRWLRIAASPRVSKLRDGFSVPRKQPSDPLRGSGHALDAFALEEGDTTWSRGHSSAPPDDGS